MVAENIRSKHKSFVDRLVAFIVLGGLEMRKIFFILLFVFGTYYFVKILIKNSVVKR